MIHSFQQIKKIYLRRNIFDFDELLKYWLTKPLKRRQKTILSLMYNSWPGC